MKQWKKYPFFFMILISSLIYGGGQLLGMAAEPEGQTIQVPVAEKNTSAGKEEGVKAVPKELLQDEKGIGEEAGGGKKGGEAEKIEEAGNGQTGEGEETPGAGNGQTGQGAETLGAENGQTGQGAETPEEENGQTGAGDEEQPEAETREFQRVEMDYLDDALFIGDSRTSTLYEYAGWENTDFFVKYGQSVWEVWDSEIEGRTLEQMLTEKKYGKIYIMLGINELGTGTAQSFREQFKNVVEQIRQLQPDAVIFVEAIIHVTPGKDAENTYINNQEINARNEELKTLADNKTIFYIDVNEVMDGPGTGKLNEDYTFDGVHLKVKYIDVWQEFLLNHGIV